MILRARSVGLILLVWLALVALLLSVAFGAANLPISTVLDVVLGGGEPTERTIVLELRMPRAVLGLVSGGSLAVSGAVFQALLRNPLAEPYVLGISGGAAVGAVAVIVLGVATGLVPVGALLGALVAIGLVLRIATQTGRGLDTRVLLLAGVIASAFFQAIILVLLTLADVESFRSAVFWMMGSLASATWTDATMLGLYVAPSIVVLLALARPLNLLATGEETAQHLGLNVQRTKLVAFLVASLLVAASVAVCGVIGFIGLVIPHAIRMIWGVDHRFLLPASFIGGGAFLLLADTGARTVAAPAELPIGVITALIGVPIFVVLLRRRIA
ncbi:MAG: iron ABC transporter permease [Gemmatimonadota bacterium]